GTEWRRHRVRSDADGCLRPRRSSRFRGELWSPPAAGRVGRRVRRAWPARCEFLKLLSSHLLGSAFNYAELSPVTVVAASFPSGTFLTFASPVDSQSEARAQPLTAEERRRTRSRAQAAIETGRIERGVRCEHEDVAVPAALEDPRFGGRCQVAEVVAERGQLRLQHSVITGVGDIGQIESGVLERLRAGGEELPGLQGGRHRVVVEGVSDDDVEGIGPEPTDLRGTVTGAQGQSGGAGQVEPLAGEVEQGGIDVDRRLLRSRARRVEGSGQ